MKAESVPVMSLEKELITKLASRAQLVPDDIVGKHVLFLNDRPNYGRSDSQSYSDREITMAIIMDDPVVFDYITTGAAIKSPDDQPDTERGNTISLSRAFRSL